jgi:hypothetical protein
MIQGSIKPTEAQYRAKMLDSSSSLKDFAQNRKKYYKKYILNEPVEDEENKAMVTGLIVELLLLEPEKFDLKFHMSACASAPTGLMLSFVEALYKYTIEATNEEGVVMRDFADISQDAYVASGFKIKYAAVIEKFAGSDAEIYYNEILKVRQNNLTVVTTLDVTNAEKIVEELKTNFVTKDIVNLVSSDKWEVHQQLQVENYKIGNLSFKSMMDLVHINHVDKSIQVYDLKTTWNLENFYYDYYLKRLAYIQAFVYHMAIRHYRDQNFPGYSIRPIKFIVCDSTNYYNPLIYALTLDDLKEARDGFEYKGRIYTGVTSLIDSLEWALIENQWSMSKENYLLNGVVPLKK